MSTTPGWPRLLIASTLALGVAGCTPAVDRSDPPATTPTTAATGAATPGTRPVLDLRDGPWPRMEPLASASGDDTADVRLSGLPSSDVDQAVWILWRRATTDPDQVFRVTQTQVDTLRHLTRGDVAGISQQVVLGGQTTLEVRVVSPDDPWELTVFAGGGSQLPDLGVEDVTGSGPTWLGVSRPLLVDLELERPDQLTLVQLYDSRGQIVSDAGLTPEQVAEPIELPADVTLMLLDVDGPWRLRAVD